jgi:prepilin-type processing-associated H-X9-DG protein
VGDDNFEINGTPVKSGVLEIRTNTPIAWTGERHKFWGNIGFADGSVQSGTSSWLTNAIIKQYEPTFGVVTNGFAFAIP